MSRQPIIVLNQNTTREQGRKVQLGNVQAAKVVSDIIRTCLGPRSMLKMILDPMGGIVMTNDGNAVLREIEVGHPAAKSMIEIARTLDEEVGDGTTSVIVIAGEILTLAMPFLEQMMHPTVVIGAYLNALEDMVEVMDNQLCKKIDIKDDDAIRTIVKSCVGTKFMKKWADLACDIAVKAVRTVACEIQGRQEIDIKRYAKVEKVPGGEMTDCCVLDGLMLNKDITHQKMRRMIKNPKILLLDCTLEYKKGESQTNIEVSKEDDWMNILKQEEEFIENICKDIIAVKPDLLFTEKGISDHAQHFLAKNGITAIRRVRKSDNNRIARAVGATIVHRTEELKESHLGHGCGLFEIKKIGDEYFTFLTQCKDPKACTILLRGASKEVLHEVDRNLQDALNCARNLLQDPRLLPGGGATEMALACILREKAMAIEGVRQRPYRAAAEALEVIPRTLIQNCGANVIRTITALRAKHSSVDNKNWGINGETGVLVDMEEYGIWEPYNVKAQTLKTAVETSILLLRIDDIVAGVKKQADL